MPHRRELQHTGRPADGGCLQSRSGAVCPARRAFRRRTVNRSGRLA